MRRLGSNEIVFFFRTIKEDKIKSVRSIDTAQTRRTMECAYTHTTYTDEDEDADDGDDHKQIWQKEVKRSQSETLLFDR